MIDRRSPIARVSLRKMSVPGTTEGRRAGDGYIGPVFALREAGLLRNHFKNPSCRLRRSGEERYAASGKKDF
jgi:hypothetical protein